LHTQKGNQMARITINLETKLAKFAKKRAAAARRSVSSYLVTLIEADIDDAGLVQTAANELRTHGIDPVSALRNAIGEVERDTILSPRA
jgi:hypothetical protein